MDASYKNFRTGWELVSASEADCVISEYEYSLSSQYSDKQKYHMKKVVSPQKKSLLYSIY